MKKNKNKGFTLVELLAVIVVLAIIMLLAIPVVLDTMEVAKKKTFIEYIDKAGGLAQKSYLEKLTNGESVSGCFIYNVKTDLGLDNTGSFEGWVLINTIDNDSYITLFNDDYAVVAFHYTDSSKKIESEMKNRNAVNIDDLTVNYLCNYSNCINCSYESSGDTIEIDPTEFRYNGAALLVNGETFNKRIRQLYGADQNINQAFDGVTNIVLSKTLDESKENINLSDKEDINIYAWKDNSTLYLYTDSPFGIYANSNIDSMFKYWTNITSIDMSIFNTLKVNTARFVFQYCSSLTNINLKSFDTKNVTNFKGLFQGCTSLESLDISHFKTSNVKDLTDTFANCKNLKYVDVSHFDTSKVIWLNHTFIGCNSLKSIDVSHFNTSNVTHMVKLFSGCNSLESLDLSNWDTSNVESMLEMFRNCSSLKSLDLTTFDISKVEYIYQLCSGCINLEHVYVSSKWQLPSAIGEENGFSMFSGCSKLPNWDVNKNLIDYAFKDEKDGGFVTYV